MLCVVPLLFCMLVLSRPCNIVQCQSTSRLSSSSAVLYKLFCALMLRAGVHRAELLYVNLLHSELTTHTTVRWQFLR